jgi:hypothetical protein
MAVINSGTMPPAAQPPTSLRDFVAQYARRGLSSESVYESMRLESVSVAPGPINRMFATMTGNVLHNVLGHEHSTLPALGLFAADVLGEAINMTASLPALQSALAAVPDLVRRMGVFNRDLGTDLLILLPKGYAPATPQTIDPKSFMTPQLLEKAVAAVAARNQLVSESALNFLYDGDVHKAIDALWSVQPSIVVARNPAMERLSYPIPALSVQGPGETSSAGAFAKDKNGKPGVTVAYHATGGVGTVIHVAGQSATISAASQTMDSAFALLADISAFPAKPTKGAMAKRAPAPGEVMQFCGAVSGDVQTYVQGADLGLPGVDTGRMRCVQTGRDTNVGDSGAALVNDANEIVGFAYQRSKFTDRPAFSDWVWARAVFDVLELTP